MLHWISSRVAGALCGTAGRVRVGNSNRLTRSEISRSVDTLKPCSTFARFLSGGRSMLARPLPEVQASAPKGSMRVNFGDAETFETFGVILAVEDVPFLAAFEDFFLLRGD